MTVKSGAVTYSDAPSLAESEQKGEELAGILKAPATGKLKYLRDLPAADLLKAVSAPRMSIGPANGIVVDGWVLPKPPAQLFAKGEEHRVPLLIGNNSRERTPPSVAPEDLRRAIEAMYGSLASRAFALYGQNAADDPLYGGQATQWVVDTMYRCPVVAQLIWHANAGNASFEYQFDRAAPGREALGAVHGAEVPYVFGALGDRYAPADRQISGTMQEYWTNFAKTGNPDNRWPKFDTASRGYLEFTSDGPVPGEGLRRPFCDLYVENVKRLMAQ
jgi:para-nitrobenzyl esterase